ncbi:MAG: 50S ribosomal protein L18 [Patescibacteria group bacterium]
MPLRQVRHKRTKARIAGSNKARLNVYRSDKHIYAQIIDDKSMSTIVAVHSKSLKSSGSKLDISKQVGIELAKLALAKNIDTVVFDRGGYIYHGRVKALAEGAREGGLQF